MSVDFNLEDLTNTLEKWRAEAMGDNNRLRLLANHLGHDLRTPVNYINGFCNILLANDDDPITADQQKIIKELEGIVGSYLSGLSLMGSFVTGINTYGPKPKDSSLGSQIYLTSVDNLGEYIPFLNKLFENGPITDSIKDFSPLIDSGLKQLIYSANKFFAPVQECYRIDLDTKFLIKDQSSRLSTEKIYVEDKLDAASFKEDYVGGVISYLLNNTIDHAFDGVNDREKYLSLKGTVEGSMCSLIVQDNGTGIDSELFPDPNEIFGYRKSRRAHEGEHHGKGLYLVKEFVKEHGGDISVENNSTGNGAKFTLKLPVYEIKC